MEPPAPTEPSSEQLAERARSGCRDSFERLVERHEKQVFNFLSQLTGRSPDAEDLTQETFVSAYRGIERYRSEHRFTTWLFTIARRAAIDHFRRRRPDAQPVSEDEPSGADDPARSCERRDEAESLWDQARRLSANQFQALWLRYHDGFATEEIARIMGTNTVHVKVLLHRGRAQLAKRLESKQLCAARRSV